MFSPSRGRDIQTRFAPFVHPKLPLAARLGLGWGARPSRLVIVGTKRVVRAPALLRRKRRWVRSPLAENSTPLWSHQTVRRSDETWLPEWSVGMGERSGARSRSRGVSGASQSSGHLNEKF